MLAEAGKNAVVIKEAVRHVHMPNEHLKVTMEDAF